VNKWGFLNILLAGALAFVLLLLAAMHTNPNKRNHYWLQGMDESPAPADFSDNPNFANGQTLQMPPDGTLAQGEQRYPYAGGMDEAIRAGKALKNPLDPNDPQVLLRGKILFERNCMPCHGVAGRGDGLVTAARRAGGFPPPPSLLAAHAKGLPDGYIYNYISRGGILMPSYGAQINPQERWKVVSWVRHMQKSFPEALPATGTAQANDEAGLVPSTTPGFDYDGQPPVDEIEANEALQQATIENRGEASETDMPPAMVAAAAAAAAASAGAGGGTPWQQALVVINKNDCFTCHNPDHKVIGPAFKDVAKRYYSRQPGIIPILVAKVKAGGAGNWGQVPMAAHPNTSDADLTTIVKGILYLADPKGKGTSSMAPSMKRVMELVHSGAPIHCPALGAEAINGPAFLTEREPLQAEVRRVSGPDLAALGPGSVDQETKP
jgi:cytochrome c551/c552